MPITRKTTRKIKDGVWVSDTHDTTAVAIHPNNLPEPFEPDTHDLRNLLDTAITENDWKAVFRKALEMSLEGNVKAMEFIAKYRWGLPAIMSAPQGNVQTSIHIVEVVRPQTGSVKTQLKDVTPEKLENGNMNDKYDDEAEQPSNGDTPF